MTRSTGNANDETSELLTVNKLYLEFIHSIKINVNNKEN